MRQVVPTVDMGHGKAVREGSYVGTLTSCYERVLRTQRTYHVVFVTGLATRTATIIS